MVLCSEFLVILDCDKIHEYIFATGRLKEIRGASALVRRLVEKEMAKLAQFKEYPSAPRIVSAGGGVLRAVFKDCKSAKEFVTKAEKLLRTETGTASLTGCIVDCEGGFQKALSRGEWEIRKLKDSKKEAFQLCSSGFFRFCQSCGRHPAAWSNNVDGRYDGKWLCRSCQLKRKEADSIRNEPGRDRFLDALMKKDHEKKWKEAREIDELSDLGEIARPKGYIGFVYCDANRMGKRFAQIKDEKEYKEFSVKVDDAGIGAATETLQELYPEPVDGCVPFEVVMYGGDDLILICTAERAVRFAEAYCLKFQEKTEGIAVSAGVVIARASHPVLALYRQSQELLRSAKKLSYEILERENKNVCTLDFHIVTTPSMRSLDEVRENDYKRSDFSGKRWLTARPYRCGETPGIGDLIRGIESLKEAGFPRNKLNAIYEALFQLPMAQATVEALIIRSRVQGEARERFMEFVKRVGLVTSFPWVIQEGVTYTPIPDLVELYDYV